MALRKSGLRAGQKVVRGRGARGPGLRDTFIAAGKKIIGGVTRRGGKGDRRKRRYRRATFSKNFPSHRQLTRLNRFKKRWIADAKIILRLAGQHKVPRGYRGYGKRRRYARRRVRA